MKVGTYGHLPFGQIGFFRRIFLMKTYPFYQLFLRLNTNFKYNTKFGKITSMNTDNIYVSLYGRYTNVHTTRTQQTLVNNSDKCSTIYTRRGQVEIQSEDHSVANQRTRRTIRRITETAILRTTGNSKRLS